MDLTAVQSSRGSIKKWLLIPVLVGFFVVAGVLAERYTEVFTKKLPNVFQRSNKTLYPVFPGTYSIIEDGANLWKFEEIQPVFESILVEGDSTFLVVSYELKPGNKKTLRMFLTGTTSPGLVSEVLYGESNDTSFVSIEDLKTKLEQGKQIRISYLSQIPSKDMRSVSLCTIDDRLCNLANIHDKNALRIASFEKHQLITNELVIPVYSISALLKAPEYEELGGADLAEENK